MNRRRTAEFPNLASEISTQPPAVITTAAPHKGIVPYNCCIIAGAASHLCRKWMQARGISLQCQPVYGTSAESKKSKEVLLHVRESDE